METGVVRPRVCVVSNRALTWIRLAFDLDTVKLLMSIFDTDRSGTIGFNEVRLTLSIYLLCGSLTSDS
jgi:hypothetical protein